MELLKAKKFSVLFFAEPDKYGLYFRTDKPSLKYKGQFNLAGLTQAHGPTCSVPPGEDMTS